MRVSRKLVFGSLLALLALAALSDAEVEDDGIEVGEDDFEADEGYVMPEEDGQPEFVAPTPRASRAAGGHPLTNIPPPHPKVHFSHVLPNNVGNRLAIGHFVDSLFGVVNDANSPVTILSAGGSMNSPTEFKYHLQNFTLVGFNATLQPDDEGSFLYRFFPSPQVEPEDYTIALTAFYIVNDELYAQTFFNSTVTFYDASNEFDFRTLFSAIIGITVATGVLYFLWSATGAESQRGLTNPNMFAPKTTEAPKPEDDDWMAGYTGPGSRKAGSRKAGSRKTTGSRKRTDK